MAPESFHKSLTVLFLPLARFFPMTDQFTSSTLPSLPPEFLRLQNVLSAFAPDKNFALAFSGGLDSRFLAHASTLLGFYPLLLHITGPHVPPNETAFAQNWAIRRHINFCKESLDPLDLPLVSSGDRKRCYACKKALFSCLKKLTDMPLCDGTNASDTLCYRPGLQALQELGISSPLAEANLTKADIRRLAKVTGMDFPDQKARPCLLTRLPYGVPPRREVLQDLARGEGIVYALLQKVDLQDIDFRLRVTGVQKTELHVMHTDLARIPSAIQQSILSQLKIQSSLFADLHWVGLESLSGFFDRT
jgi:uncharacterized protein